MKLIGRMNACTSDSMDLYGRNNVDVFAVGDGLCVIGVGSVEVGINPELGFCDNKDESNRYVVVVRGLLPSVKYYITAASGHYGLGKTEAENIVARFIENETVDLRDNPNLQIISLDCLQPTTVIPRREES